MRFPKFPIGAALLALAACDDIGPAEHMSLAEARTALTHSAGQGSTQAFCSEEGQRAFRHAVRNFTAAVEAEHAPIDFMGSGDEAWALVSMGVMAKVVQPSDLQGPAQGFATLLSVPGLALPGVGQTRDAMSHACPELIAVYRAGSALARTEARLQRANADHDNRREIMELQQDVQTQGERVQSAMRRLELKMRAQGWTEDTLSPAARMSIEHSNVSRPN